MKLISRIFTQPYLYIFIVLLGISLKFYKLEQQFFWDDEICTILHTSGIPTADYEKQIPVNQVLSKKYFDDLLRLNSRDLRIGEQFIGLSKMPQLTPGHYYYFIFLNRIFGDSYLTYRYFSVLVFLLSVLFLFLLTRKLFNSNLTAWIVISFYTLSPLFQIYAQEARYYVLWVLAISAMHYLFLVATEKNSRFWWLLYIIAGFFSVHTTILFYVTFSVHLIYTFLYAPKTRKALVLSQLLVFLSSVPWLVYIFINRANIYENLEWHKIGDWGSLTIFELLNTHLNNFVESFSMLNGLGLGNGVMLTSIWFFRLVIVGGIVLFFVKATPKQRWFVGLMLFSGVLALVALDLIRSSGASNMIRYTLMNSIGLFVLLGFALRKAMKYTTIVSGIVLLLIVGVEFKSSLNLANDLAGGNRSDSYYHLNDANEKFSGEDKILIISDFQLISPNWFTMFMSLLHASSNPNIDIIYAKPNYPDFKQELNLNNWDTVYGMYLSDNLKAHLQQNFTSEKFVLEEKRKMYGAFDVSVYRIK